MLNTTYIEHRSAYHWVLGASLALFGGIGYFLITDVTQRAEAGTAPVLLSYAPFILPCALLLAVVPFMLEVMLRGNLYRLPEKGFLLVLLLIPVLLYGWMEFSKARFENWLTGLEYERCVHMDNDGLLPHEAWVKKGTCVSAE